MLQGTAAQPSASLQRAGSLSCRAPECPRHISLETQILSRLSLIGLTCRIGRAFFGTVSLIRDLLEQNKSILLLGRPGVGKTTAIREIARVLSDGMKKRVIIIDTSNEIAGDGDLPHPSIGKARRMQVSNHQNQHEVMIEADFLKYD